MRAVWVTGFLTACGFSKPVAATDASGDGAPSIDAPVVIDAPANFTCLGTTAATNAFEVCVDPVGLAGIALAGTIDTSSDPRCMASTVARWTSAGQPDACFIAGTSITFTGDITVIGARPLVLVATASIAASSRLLDASAMGTTSGPGPQLCGAFQRTPGGKGGGAGGSFMTVGGGGGDNLDGPSLGGIAPAPSSAPLALRGGCPGQTGGGNNLGGGGGGAVYLVAGTTIDLGSSQLDLSGGGGRGGGDEEGGGGGGTGGMLLMFAKTAIMGGSAKLNANGGGGGGGGGNNASGQPGGETDPNTPNVGGTGGTTSMGGGAGGAGAPSLAVAGSPSTDRGGGGGGGGAGYIRANQSFSTSGGVSPAPAIIQ